MTPESPSRGTSPERRFLWTFVVTAVAGCMLISLLNVIVNPLGYYPTHVLRPLTWSSRGLKVKLMRDGRPASILVIGSSRTMKMAPREIEQLTGQTAFNASIDAARVEDDLSMLTFAIDDMKWPVREVALGLDLEAFHDHVAADPRNASVPELRDHLPLVTRLELVEDVARSSLTLGQTLESVRSVLLARAGYPAEKAVFDADGYLHYLDWEKAVRDGTFKMSPNIAEYSAHLDGFTAIDRDRLALFDALLDRAQTHGIRVRAFLTPLQGDLLKHLESSPRFSALRRQLVDEMRRRVGRYAGFSFDDFTEVGAFGGSNELFFDGVHVREENAHELVRSLWAVR